MTLMNFACCRCELVFAKEMYIMFPFVCIYCLILIFISGKKYEAYDNVLDIGPNILLYDINTNTCMYRYVLLICHSSSVFIISVHFYCSIEGKLSLSMALHQEELLVGSLA